MVTLCLIVPYSLLQNLFYKSHCSYFPSIPDESEWQMPFNLEELKHREYKEFV